MNPFAEDCPDRHVASALLAELQRGLLSAELNQSGGKMFGVLLAKDASGQTHELRAFSGMLGGVWHLPGFVPPMFDPEARAQVEPEGERVLARLNAQYDALDAELQPLLAAHARDVLSLQSQHARNRQERKRLRALGHDADALDQQSRRDKAEKRQLEAAHAPVKRRMRRLLAIGRLRRYVSARLMRAIAATYVVRNAQGETCPLASLFPQQPPAGAGDCAAPKLLAHAFSLGLEPLALTEFFFGVGGRKSGEFYPACRTKCGPILAFMLPRAVPQPQPLVVLFEDEHVIAVDKPAGLLSVPGKGNEWSVLALLQQRWPQAHLAHRLDLDTSGILLAAKNHATYVALQRQFAARTIDKRYVAILSGALNVEAGDITLPLRVDPDDRPRQVVDPVHGRAAHTRFERLSPTRVSFTPLTGRTHQLRVHAASGLGLPIVGDRLYGTGGQRLLLHACRLDFTHPQTGQRVSVVSPAPF